MIMANDLRSKVNKRIHLSRRLWVLIVIAFMTGVFTWYLSDFYIISLKDDVAKATVAAGAITLFGVVFSAMYKEISDYYKHRSAIASRKWDLIFPFIKSGYYPWINSAWSLHSSLKGLNPNAMSDEDVTRVLYLTMVFFGYRLRLVLNDGGLILLSSDKEEKEVMAAYRRIEKDFQWAKDETPRRVSYLQHLFLSRNKADNPYVLAKFAEDFANDRNIKESKERLELWLTNENIECLKTALEDFANYFKDCVNRLYAAWCD
jgi:hypothetical protein